jgi:3-hydroxybutyryl-CoA dehydratase
MAIGFDDIEEGRTYTTARRTVTDADIANFAGLSGDFNPLHMDDLFAKEATPYGRRVAHGLVGLSIGTGLRSEMDDWYVLGWLEVQRRFEGPVFPGDTIHIEAAVKSKRRSRSKPDRGIVVLTIELVNQAGAVVQSGEDTVLMGTAIEET